MVLWLAEPRLTTFHISHIISVKVTRTIDVNTGRYKTKTKGLTQKFSLMRCKISQGAKVSYFSNIVDIQFQTEIQIWTLAKSFSAFPLLC